MKKYTAIIFLIVAMLLMCACAHQENQSTSGNVDIPISKPLSTESKQNVSEETAKDEKILPKTKEEEKPPTEDSEDTIKEEEIQSEQAEYNMLFEAQEPADEEQDTTVAEQENTVSLMVDCSDILGNIEALKEEKRGLVPDGGIIFSGADIEICEGDSVFDVLKRALTAQGIHLEFNLAPVTNSAYIEGIGNIYEFDCGERSGWKYSVNGEFPRVGCSDYKVKSGDKIVFVYKIKAY